MAGDAGGVDGRAELVRAAEPRHAAVHRDQRPEHADCRPVCVPVGAAEAPDVAEPPHPLDRRRAGAVAQHPRRRGAGRVGSVDVDVIHARELDHPCQRMQLPDEQGHPRALRVPCRDHLAPRDPVSVGESSPAAAALRSSLARREPASPSP